jgi:NADH-quinone oxidoreductase subunit J
MDLTPWLFWITALLTAASAVGVVVTQNIVRAAAWLLFALGGTAGIFFLLGADFVGATQLLVYVGGTLVLVVFGVMLTAQGPFISMKTGASEWGLAAVVGLTLYAVLAFAVLAPPPPSVPAVPVTERRAGPVPAAADSRSADQLGAAFLGVPQVTPEHPLTSMPGPAPLRRRMGYLLPFEIVSVHLLVVLIGAAYLARAKRRRGATS